MYGKKGYYFLDGKQGIFAYTPAGRDSVMLERVRYTTYKGKEDVFNVPVTPKGRKFVCLEIPWAWLEAVEEMIRMLKSRVDPGDRDEVGDLMNRLWGK
jgi:hypothetical protein